MEPKTKEEAMVLNIMDAFKYCNGEHVEKRIVNLVEQYKLYVKRETIADVRTKLNEI